MRIDEGADRCDVWIEQYGEPFQLLPNGALRYTLAPNGDGSFRYLSVKAFPAVPES